MRSWKLQPPLLQEHSIGWPGVRELDTSNRVSRKYCNSIRLLLLPGFTSRPVFFRCNVKTPLGSSGNVASLVSIPARLTEMVLSLFVQLINSSSFSTCFSKSVHWRQMLAVVCLPLRPSCMMTPTQYTSSYILIIMRSIHVTFVIIMQTCDGNVTVTVLDLVNNIFYMHLSVNSSPYPQYVDMHCLCTCCVADGGGCFAAAQKGSIPSIIMKSIITTLWATDEHFPKF